MPAFINEWIEIPVSVSKKQKLQLGQAKDAWKAERWAEAYALCDELVGEGMETSEIAQLRLRAALKLNDPDKISGALTDMSDARSTFAAARALAKAERLEAAAATFGSLRSRHPDFRHQSLLPSVERLATKLAAQGDAILRTENIRGAAAVWQSALSADPGNAGLTKRLRAAKRHALTDAAARNLDEDAQRYADAWSLVIAIDPTDKQSYKRLALAAEKYENFSAATECWKHLIMVDPANEVAPSRLARSAARSDDPSAYLSFLHGRGLADMANPYFQRLARQTVVAARAQVKQKNFAAAAPSLVLLRQLNVADPRMQGLIDATVRNLVNDAKHGLKEKNFASAIELCDLVLAIDGNHAVALSILSRALFRLKSYTAAYKASQHLLDIEPDNSKYREMNDRAHLAWQRQAAAA